MKAAIYLRVSRDLQSTDMQRDDLVKYCELHNLDYDIFDETGSGKSRDRVRLTQLMERIKVGGYQRLIIWRLDRLGRSVRDLTNIIHELESHGCQLVSFKESIDMSSPAGRLMANMLGCFAQFERDVIIQRTNAGLDAARKRGKKLGPPQKELDDQKLQAMLAQSKTLDEIAKELGFSKSHLYKKIRHSHGSIRLLRAVI